MQTDLRKQLAAERERLAVTLASIGDGVVCTDVHGRVTMLNRVAEQLTGWTQAEAEGRPLAEVFNIINEKTGKPVKPPLEKVLKSGKAVGLANHTALIARDGTERSIADSCAPIKDDDGRLIGTVLVFRDVTKERQAEDALRESEERFRSVAQSATDAIINVGVSGHIVFWNQAAERIFGYSEGEAVGKPLTAMMPERFRSAHQAGLGKAVARQSRTADGRTVELTALTKDGREFPIELSLSSWRSGGELYFTGIVRDITKRKQVEEALAAERERLAKLYAEEHRIAMILQEALLTMPEKVPGVDFGHLYRSAMFDLARVGGDFYDLFDLTGDKVGLLIGDVSGKGIKAATLTSLVKNTVRAFASQGDDPAAVMRKTNDIIIDMAVRKAFVTAFFGVLDKKSGVFTYCGAGHPPAVLRKKADHRTLTLLNSDSPALGVLEELDFKASRETLEQGDILVLYTDGLTESRRQSEFFSERRLFELVKESPTVTVRELPDRIFTEVSDFAAGVLRDDLAILAVSLTGKAGRRQRGPKAGLN